MTGSRGKMTGAGSTSRAEWVVAWVSAALIVGIVGYLLREELGGERTPPDLLVRVDSVTAASQGFRAHFTTLNRGGTTAARVHVGAELHDGASLLEESRMTLDYVPAEGERTAALYFSRDPRRHALTIRPLGYELP